MSSYYRFHQKCFPKYSGKNIAPIVCDAKASRLVFDKPNTLLTCQTVDVNVTNSHIIYTEGSRTKQRVGYGIYSRSLNPTLNSLRIEKQAQFKLSFLSILYPQKNRRTGLSYAGSYVFIQAVDRHY